MPNVPLVAKGEPGPPRIVEIQEKYSAVEEQTAVCYMFIEGNPAPTFRFNKVRWPLNCSLSISMFNVHLLIRVRSILRREVDTSLSAMVTTTT